MCLDLKKKKRKKDCSCTQTKQKTKEFTVAKRLPLPEHLCACIPG